MLQHNLTLTHKSSPVQRSSILLIKGIDVGSFTEQEVHHLTHTRRWRKNLSLYVWVLALRIQPLTKARTSVWPLRAAWCSAVRPPRSDTLTLLRSGMITSAQRRALLAAATCSGVCQFLSRAFTSAEWWIRTRTASWGKDEVRFCEPIYRVHVEVFLDQCMHIKWGLFTVLLCVSTDSGVSVIFQCLSFGLSPW